MAVTMVTVVSITTRLLLSDQRYRGNNQRHLRWPVEANNMMIVMSWLVVFSHSAELTGQMSLLLFIIYYVLVYPEFIVQQCGCRWELNCFVQQMNVGSVNLNLLLFVMILYCMYKLEQTHLYNVIYFYECLVEVGRVWLWYDWTLVSLANDYNWKHLCWLQTCSYITCPAATPLNASLAAAAAAATAHGSNWADVFFQHK